MAWSRGFLTNGTAGRIALAATLACLTFPCAGATQAAEKTSVERLALTTQRLAWNDEDPNDIAVGAFEWMGSIVIDADHKRFGGWTSLAVSADGASLLSVSSAGKWFTAKILYDERGRIAGVGDGWMGALSGLDGQPMPRNIGYAGGIATDSIDLHGGYAYVSFERAHRIWRYRLTAQGIEGKPEVIITQRNLGRLAANGGIEGLALMEDEGRDPRSEDKHLFAVTEYSRDARGNVRAFIIRGRNSHRLAIKLHDPYQPVDLVRLPDGNYLMLERRFSLLAGRGVKLRRIAREEVKPGATIDGDVLLKVEDKNKIDNMEGLAVRQGRDDELWFYMISDNNFNELQRTQLTMFRLRKPEPEPKAAAAPAAAP